MMKNKGNKMRTLNIFLSTMACLFLTNCTSGMMQEKIALPKNAELSPMDGGYSYIDKINFEYISVGGSFSKLKTCIAENIEDGDIVLEGLSGMWVGPYTGKVYSAHNSRLVPGKEVFIHDDGRNLIIARGKTSFSFSFGLASITKSVSFNIKTLLKNNKLEVAFSKIKGAHIDGGYGGMPDFTVIGDWSGAHPMETYSNLKKISDDLANCLK